jgi:hypothetical protein
MQDRIPHRIIYVLGEACFIAMTKLLGGVCFIIVTEPLYQLINHALCFQFCDAFATHLSLHEFDVATKGGCEAIIHGIRCTLDLHPKWVVF